LQTVISVVLNSCQFSPDTETDVGVSHVEQWIQ